MEYVDIGTIVWLLLPAGAANVAPIIAAKMDLWPQLGVPVDGGKGILGDNKTWRGFIVGPVVGALVGGILHFIWPTGPLEEAGMALGFGFIIGLAALIGDALASLLKRLVRIPSGKPFPVVDQIDWVVTSLIVVIIVVPVSPLLLLVVAVGFAILSLLFSYVGVQLGIKQGM